MNPDKKKNNRDIVFTVLDLLFDEEIKSNKDAEKVIKQAGKNPEVIIQEGNKLLEKIKADIRLEAARKKKKAFEEEAVALKEIFEQIKGVASGQDRRTLIKKLFGSRDKQLAFSYRKLEKLSDNDLASIDSEEKLLSLWTEFILDKEE